MLSMLFFWILVIMCLSFLLKGFFPSILTAKQAIRSNAAALDTICERYAKGEIDQEEFEMQKEEFMG